MDLYQVDKLMAEARRLAAEYRRATGRTLAISGEIATSDAINLLGLEPAPEGASGYDAVRTSVEPHERVQVKARVVFDDSRRGQRLGQLGLDRGWDVLVLVLMDEDYEPGEIYEAPRAVLEEALAAMKPNRRGSLSVARFRNLGRLVWERDRGLVTGAG
ncbi:MAG: hypothetical protein ACU85V_05795 [Gammaproteobacteria bacterium]